MRSPTDRLLDGIEAWQRDRATERVARWREDPDALGEAQVTHRHARLVGPRARELYEDAVDRGDLEGDVRAAVDCALREAHVTGPRAMGDQRLAAVFDAPVPYDSDFHRAGELWLRIGTRSDARTRRAMARALEPCFSAALRALAERRSRVEEASERAAWVSLAHPDRGEVDSAAVLSATEEPWRELLARLAHAARSPMEDWSDLAHVLRAHRWDDAVPRRSRPRRVSEGLDALGWAEMLGRGARVETGSSRPRAQVLVVAPSEDVRVRPGVELGVFSERDFAGAIGRAAAHLLAHPGLPPILRRPGPESVARAIGALCAHLYSDRVFVDRAQGHLSASLRRELRELSFGVELFELRTAAAAHLLAGREDRGDFLDEARDRVAAAWTVDVPPGLAALVAQDRSAEARLRAARLAPDLAVAFREQYDEDFWRNPRSGEALRHGASRGGALSAEAWAAELGVTDGAFSARMTELLG